MQPTGYGAAEIHQHQPHQLMDDDSSSSVFTTSNHHNQTHHHHLYQLLPSQQQQKQQPLLVFSQHQQQQQQPPTHSLPITQQLFHHQNRQFQAFQSEILHQPHHNCNGPDPSLDMNFKLGLDANSASFVVNQEHGGFLLGNDQNISRIRQRSLVMPHCWHSQEDSAIKQRFWCNSKQSEEDKRQEIECNKNEKHDHALIQQQQQEVDQTNERCKNLENKYRLFGELEAIYNLSKIVDANQTGSGSALTGENSPKDGGATLSMPSRDMQCKIVVETGGANNATGGDHGSENSIGEEAVMMKIQKKKRKRKYKEKLGTVAGFFESLVKQVMDHQEGLHRKFLEVIETMDRERTEREEAWRRQESAKYNREAVARTHEQKLASNREALIITHMEKITGQNISLPPRKSPLLLQPQPEVTKEPNKESTSMKMDTNSRWPKAEVEALIQVRSGLESRFLEPGLKGPLWDEVSSLMASMGYQRSAKRCKEKWENINKYFRKTKERGKKRSLQSKTCSYFNHLDQLYSRNTPVNLPSCSSNPSFSSDIGVQSQGYKELLEAFGGGSDLGIAQDSTSGKLKVSEMGYLRLDLDGIGDERVEFEQGSFDNEQENNRDDYQLGDEEDKTDSEEGD